VMLLAPCRHANHNKTCALCATPDSRPPGKYQVTGHNLTDRPCPGRTAVGSVAG